jgi:hypothetical protein
MHGREGGARSHTRAVSAFFGSSVLLPLVDPGFRADKRKSFSRLLSVALRGEKKRGEENEEHGRGEEKT